MYRTLIHLMLLGAALAAQSKPEVAFRAAVETETVKGDLKNAIEQYRKIAQGSDRSLAAKALLRMADCHAKLGQNEAEAIYRRLLREFADQMETVGEAQKRLTALGAVKTTTFAKRRLCAACGDGDMDVSTDGRWLVYSHWDSGDLAMRDVATMTEKRLMLRPGTWKDSDDYIEYPVFSPDRKQIVYLWWDGVRKQAQLRVVPNEPGARQKVIIDTPENTYYRPIAWAADGKRILSLIFKSDRSEQLAWIATADGGVTMLKSLGWRPRYLRARPRLSPDGRFIAYSALAVNPKSWQGPFDVAEKRIYVLAADGSSETELDKTAGVNNFPIWSADGKALLFTSDRAGNSTVWSVSMKDGRPAGAPRMIDTVAGEAIGMTADGTFYYTQPSSEVEQVFLDDLELGESSSQRRSTVERTFVGIRPAWSPDGRSLAFTRRRDARSWYVVVKSMESGEETAYPFEGTRPAPNRWFHDGKALLVMVDPPGKPRTLYRLDLTTKEYRAVMETPVDRFAPGITALAADDKTLYIGGRSAEKSNSIDRILSINLATGEQRQIFQASNTQILFFRLSPDGRMLSTRYYDPSDRKAHYGVLAVDGSGYRDIYTADNGLFDTHTWAGDGRSLLFEDRSADGKWRILRVPIDGGPAQPTGIQGEGQLQTLDVSPDGRRIAFSVLRGQKELWAIDNLQAALP